MSPHLALVRVALRDLRLGEEFTTSCSRKSGRVVSWGYVHDQDGGRASRVRAVLCRFGLIERILHAEVLVLVPFDRPHCRHERDERRRWGQLLREPYTPERVIERESHFHASPRALLMQAKARGLPC